MNGDIRAAAELLAELRETYRAVPKPIQAHVRHLLLHRAALEGAASLPSGTNGAIGD